MNPSMNPSDQPDGAPSEHRTTRHALHCVAEHVMAAVRYRATGRIGLVVTSNGFGTPPFERDGIEFQVRVDGTTLVVSEGGIERRRPLTTIAEAAQLVGIEPGGPGDVYSLATMLDPDADLAVDGRAAAAIHDWFALTGEALERFRRLHADRGAEMAQLWPEHFDLAITLDEVNYGGSPGDEWSPVPYAYVGPWDPARRDGAFWNAPSGASRSIADIASADAMVEFFDTGRRLATS
jgi:hypothetical protein